MGLLVSQLKEWSVEALQEHADAAAPYVYVLSRIENKLGKSAEDDSNVLEYALYIKENIATVAFTSTLVPKKEWDETIAYLYILNRIIQFANKKGITV